ncbi:MAG TPA: fatty acid desaturase [Verrucomicrobiae bacterium]|nr:fatty acid desaturase [Verrucomicrobiae bacterium]
MNVEAATSQDGKKPIFATAPPDMPIPDRLNFFLVILVFSIALGLLWLASHVGNGWLVAGIGVVFSYLLLTNYALLHEASHGNLQSSSRRNYWLGVMAGFLFPMPFTMMRSTHQGHHDHNRTDVEMFDLYYPEDSRVVKYIRWYGILCGFFWPIVPVGAVIFSLAPRVIREKVFGRHKPTGYLLNGVQNAAVWLVRAETLSIIALFTVLFWLLDLHWQNTLVLYACFAFNWSTRQYIGHAFSNRDLIDGAWNLRHNRWMSALLLHGEYDLSHHRHPEISWYYLPRLEPKDPSQPNYIKQYWRQWLGPRPVSESKPTASNSAAAHQ